MTAAAWFRRALRCPLSWRERTRAMFWLARYPRHIGVGKPER